MGMSPAFVRGKAGALSKGLREAGLFCLLLWQRAQSHRLTLYAGALAYTTLLSLVPAATVVLVVAARINPEEAATLVRRFAQLLPYSPQQVQDSIATFASRIAALGAAAVGLAFFGALTALVQVEQAFVAMVPEGRRRRFLRWGALAAFLLLGPLLAVGFLGLEQALAAAGLAFLLPLFRLVGSYATLLAALVLMYKFLPPTTLSWRAAGAGALVGGSLAYALSQGVKLYLRLLPQVNAVYGPLSLLLVLLVSLMVFWLALLLGGEVALLLAEKES